jgi:hypothetical protein
VTSAPPTAAGYARFDLHETHFGVKAYSKDPRLKGVDSVDRGMVCQGMVRREVAHTREALEEAILDALSSVRAGVRRGWFSHGRYEPRDQCS